MNRKRVMATFIVSCTISVWLLVQYWGTASDSGKKVISRMYSFADSADQKGNLVEAKQDAIRTRKTAEINGERSSKSNDETVNTTTASGKSKINFIYMIQTESCLGPYLLRPGLFGDGCENDVLVLSWKQPCTQDLTHLKHIKYIYKPSSSWSEGRNLLYRLAKKFPKNYLYYIFMDDDMTFDFTNSDFSKRYRDLGISSPLQAFEDFLLKYEPAIGVPLYCRSSTRSDCDKMYQLRPIPEYLPVTVHFDAAFTAFHKNASDLMLPYRLDFEKQSWWQSQKFVILAADLMFRGQVLRFGPLLTNNNAHRPYPRWNADNWTQLYNILKAEMPKEFRDRVVDWKPNNGNIEAMPVVQDGTVITPIWRMKIPTEKITIEPYKHLKTS